MTVHPVRMTGLVVGAPQTYHYFDQIQDHIVDLVTENSRISREDFERYMMATGEHGDGCGNGPLWRGGGQVRLWTSLGRCLTRSAIFTGRSRAEKALRGESNG